VLAAGALADEANAELEAIALLAMLIDAEAMDVDGLLTVLLLLLLCVEVAEPVSTIADEVNRK
jgi:hypothetical protein